MCCLCGNRLAYSTVGRREAGEGTGAGAGQEPELLLVVSRNYSCFQVASAFSCATVAAAALLYGCPGGRIVAAIMRHTPPILPCWRQRQPGQVNCNLCMATSCAWRAALPALGGTCCSAWRKTTAKSLSSCGSRISC